MKREVMPYDFTAIGKAIKTARKANGLTREQLGGKLNIAPRYIVSIENEGQHPSLQVFYELVTFFNISVDQFFFPDRNADKTTCRRQLDIMLDSLGEKDLIVVTATTKGIQESKEAGK